MLLNAFRRPAALLAGLVLIAAAAAARDQDDPPAPKFKLSFIERIRQETSDNVAGLDDAASDTSSYVRFRTSLMGQWTPSAALEFGVRLTNENRYYLAPKSDPKLKTNYSLNEVFFDALYMKWKNAAGLPLTLTLGRQDIFLGEGFVVWDGGPLDGSRSAYFNAVRADWAMGAAHTLTFLYINQPRTDTLLPVMRSVDQPMVEQAEEGFGAYYSGAVAKTKIEAYLLRKSVSGFEALPSTRYTMLGARAVHPWSDKLSLTAEAALQSGTLGSYDRGGFGGYFHLDYKTGFKFPAPAQFTLGGIFLSGDDPATDDDEGWDPTFSRWPKWGESFIYRLAKETRPAEWTNFQSLYLMTQIAPSDNVKLNVTWHHLSAPRPAPAAMPRRGDGTRRGELLIARLNYDISRTLSGHFVWEQFLPGDFYIAGASSYAWVRFELLFRY